MSYTNGLGSLQGSFNTQEVAAAGSAAVAGKTAPKPGSVTTTAPDQAKVSTAGALVAQALSGSDVRFDKVAALQGQIAAGTYNVPASDVADKIVSSLLS